MPLVSAPMIYILRYAAVETPTKVDGGVTGWLSAKAAETKARTRIENQNDNKSKARDRDRKLHRLSPRLEIKTPAYEDFAEGGLLEIYIWAGVGN